MTLAVLLLGAGCAKTDAPENPNPAPEPVANAAAAIEVEAEAGNEGLEITDIEVTTDAEADATVNIAPTQPSAEPKQDAPTPAPSQQTPPAAVTIDLASSNFAFSPAEVKVKAGAPINLKFSTSEGFHTFLIDSLNLKKSVAAGTTVTFNAPTAPGRYPYYCDVGSHRSLGMEGVLVVE